MIKLYRLIQVNKETGAEEVIYGHATENVMEQFWAAYVDDSHSVRIEVVGAEEIQQTKVVKHLHHGIVYDLTEEGRCSWHNCTHNVYGSFDEPIVIDPDGYQCADARLGNYVCCGQKIAPDFVCWEKY